METDSILDIVAGTYKLDAHSIENLEHTKSEIKTHDGVVKYSVVSLATDIFDYDKSLDLAFKIDFELESVVPKNTLEQIDKKLYQEGFSYKELLHKNIFRKHIWNDLQDILQKVDCDSVVTQGKLILMHRYIGEEFQIVHRINGDINEVLFTTNDLKIAQKELERFYYMYLSYGSYAIEVISGDTFEGTDFESNDSITVGIEKV